MWVKLLNTMGVDPNDEIPASILKREARRQELIEKRVQVLKDQAQALQEATLQEQEPIDGPSTLIGFNYLKGLEDEDNSNNIRRFINLNRLLRGKYDGKIEAVNGEQESNIRGEDSERHI